MSATLAQYLLAAALGALTGMSELISRYRDSPLGVLSTLAAWIYMAVNAGASAAALALAILLQIDFKATAESAPWIRTLAAGFGAMAVLRSSLFSRQAGGADVRIGPGTLLQSLLESADRSVDRAGARRRARQAKTLAEGIDFAKAYAALPAFCFTLMQNLSKEELTAAGESLKALKQSEIADEIKAQMLMVYLLNAVGYDALKSAKESLGDKLH